MDEAIRKADVLIEALEWIRRFRGRYVVIKLGGSALDEAKSVRSVLTDVIFMETVGMRPILVHGGGKAISRAMSEAGIEPRFVQGRRYTDRQTLEIAAHVLTDEICGSLVAQIHKLGGQAAGLHYQSENCLIAEKIALHDSDRQPLDLGAVGEVVDLDRDLLDRTCRAETIPVIPSVALDREGHKLNINADTAAAAVARFLGAEKLVFLSDVPGIFRNRSNSDSLISHLAAEQCRQLIDEGVIEAGMVPKVDAALTALQAGVKKVHIVDARIPHSVLLEIYSNQGIGTEIVADDRPEGEAEPGQHDSHASPFG